MKNNSHDDDHAAGHPDAGSGDGDCCGRCCGSMLSSTIAFDMFGKKPEMYLPSGKTSYKTLTGCVCTLLTVGAVGAFGAMLAMNNIMNQDEFSVQTTPSPDFFEVTDSFPEEDQMDHVRFAFGITEVGYPD